MPSSVHILCNNRVRDFLSHMALPARKPGMLSLQNKSGRRMVEGFLVEVHQCERAAVVFLVALHTLLLTNRCVKSGVRLNTRPELGVTVKTPVVRHFSPERMTLRAVRHSLKVRMRRGQFAG
jgi:hypothetical protein